MWMSVAAVALTIMVVASCTPGEKQIIKSVIDVAGYACIIAKADLPDEGAIASACSVEQALAPDVKRVVEDYKAKRLAFAHAQVSAIRCPEAPKAAVVPDAGAK